MQQIPSAATIKFVKFCTETCPYGFGCQLRRKSKSWEKLSHECPKLNYLRRKKCQSKSSKP